MLAVFEDGMAWIVGVLMLGLGLWGYHSSWKLRKTILRELRSQVHAYMHT